MFCPPRRRDSVGMTHTAYAPSHIAMMAAIALPLDMADVPEWVHLLPAGSTVLTNDQRGPYTMGNPGEIIAASFAEVDALEVDINHATYVAAPKGERSDAVGWVREMRADADGIWGRVEWTPEGRKLVADRAYRKISPVVIHDTQKRISRIANISLVNRPNLRGLHALNMETSMTLHARLAASLGLMATATEDELIAAIPTGFPALQSAMMEIGVALGVTGTDVGPIVAAAKAKVVAQPAELVAMQAELVTMGQQLANLQSTGKRSAAETFVDKAIGDARVGVKPMRDRFIAMHMADPAGTEAVIAGLPALSGSQAFQIPLTAETEITALNAEQIDVARMMGIPQETMLAAVKAEQKTKETR